MDYQFRSINRGEHSIMEQIRAQGVDPLSKSSFLLFEFIFSETATARPHFLVQPSRVRPH